MPKTSRRTIPVLVLAAALVNAPNDLRATSPEHPGPIVPGRFTMSIAGGEEVQNYTADLLVPLWFQSNFLMFFNPRVSLTDHDGSAEEFNLGLGARKLIGDSLIFGANIYYDHRFAATDREYQQLGAGIEFLSSWVDARCNYYLPENDREVIGSFDQTEQRRASRSWWEEPYASGHGIWQKHRTETITTTITHRYEYFEQAMKGWDAEFGVKMPGLPEWLETRLFLGGYSFDAPYGDDVQGWKGRIEVRPVRGLVIDAARYEDDELYGADWLVGARLNVPIDITGLLTGGNPFEPLKEWFRPGKQPVVERLGEMVIRDPQIHTEQWGPLENLAEKTIDVKEERSARRYALLTDVMFVDAGRSGAGENGTWEHPFDLVQEGVDGAFGRQNVYVNAFAGTYRENVVLRSGTQLYGSGWLIAGHGGRNFGSAIKPVIDGGGNGPVVRVTADNSMRGFHLVNTTPGSPRVESFPYVGPLFVENTGIVGNGFHGALQIEGNMITTRGSGIILSPEEAGVTIRDNDIEAGEFGAVVVLESATVNGLRVSGNTISAGETGLGISAMDGAAISGVSIFDNTISAGTTGLGFVSEFGSSISDVAIFDNNISGDSLGLFFQAVVDSAITDISLAENSISSGRDGLYFGAFVNSAITADISANQLTAQSYGILLETFFDETIHAFTSGSANTISSGLDAVVEFGAPGTITNTINWTR